ncbi:MAG: rhodanese-like domain-containing protein [Lewinellaceae bacterium]|nr:rhodanese-like domain-containing protein [Lewinellaceae bacterium]
MLRFLQKLIGIGPGVDVKAIMAKGGKLIDVRTPQEFALGHAKGAVNIPLQSLSHNIGKIKKMRAPIIAYCRSGNRSGIAAEILRSKGIEAYNAGSLGAVNRQLAKPGNN